MPGDAVSLEVDDNVLWAVIDRPQTLNAIDLAALAGLEAMVAVAREQRVKVVVLRGAGRAFCSGADLNELRRMLGRPAELRSFMARLGSVLEQLEQGPWVTVAAVHGYAVAGGCELLLAADIVLATMDAQIGDRHVEYGLVPAAGASVRLPSAVARLTARYLLLTGELISGAQAADRGLATLAVEPDRLDRELDRIVGRLRSRGRATLQTVKAMLVHQSNGEKGDALRRELDLFVAHATTAADAQVGLDAFRDRAVPRLD
jgi:enoyl-CoA hydratase/carnithine racemase